MTDNRTTELLCKLLEEHGIAWKKRRGYIRWSKQTEYGVTHYQAWPCFDGTITLTVRDEYGLTPEQVIAATLGSERHPYEQRITGDGSDWGEIMRDAYDDLMASACESCTPEQMDQLADYIRAELGSGTLTAEQVRECVQHVYMEGYSDGSVNRGAHIDETDWQAIADELNAVLGSGTCEVEKGEGQQARIDKLLALNGELCAEVNAQAMRMRELESLVRDTYDAWCFECNPWADDFACAWFDGSECSIRRRMGELGLEADA